MRGKFTAGTPLVRHPPHSKPDAPPSPKRAAAPKPGKAPRRQSHWIVQAANGLLAAALGIVLLGAAGGGLLGWQYYNRVVADLPTVGGLRTYQPPVMSRVYAANGALIAELADQRRIFVPYTAIPDQVKQAFVAAEDKTFWTHGGVDPAAILRAAVTDLMMMGHNRRPIGASTITQQVAKNMLLNSNAVSLSRKIREAIVATRIESTLSKKRILELYLNEIYLGAGAYGVAAASQTYFDRPLDQLSLAQAAFLGALPKAPNNYNPFRFADAAKARRDWVLDRMAEDHYVTQDQANAAKAQPIAPVTGGRTDAVPASDWFADEVKRELVDHYGNTVAAQGGLAVRTTLDPRLQAIAAAKLRDGLIEYDHRHGGWRGPVVRLNDTASLKTGWPMLLAGVPRPPGLLPDWRLGVVLEVAATTAQIGYLDPAEAGDVTPAAKTGAIYLADMGWARHNGAPPRRVADIVRPGDVVMVQPPKAAAAAARAAKNATLAAAAHPDRLLLRQIPKVEGSLVSVDPRTGRVLALVGGWSHEISQFDRAAQAARQPGSSFKPFVYLTAMEKNISPSQRFLDGPFVQDMGAQGVWAPHDFEKGYLGDVPLHIALMKSLNLPTVRLARQLGMGAVARTAIAFHMVDSMPHVLPAALGAVDTTALRAAGAYAGLAEGGKEVIPTLVDTVQDRDGHVIWRAPGLACEGCNDPAQPPRIVDNRKRIADPQSVYQLNLMMQDVVRHGTGYEASKGMGGRQIAGKTGTSQDFNDAWFDAFTPDLVTIVWIGFDQPASLGDNQTGGAIAAPVWREFMKEALKDHPMIPFAQPPGLTVQSWDSGFGRITDAFKPGQVPGANNDGGSEEGTATASADAAWNGGGDPGAAGPPARKLDSDVGGLY